MLIYWVFNSGKKYLTRHHPLIGLVDKLEANTIFNLAHSTDFSNSCFQAIFKRMSQPWLHLNVGIHESLIKINWIVIGRLKPDKTDNFYFPIEVYVCLLCYVSCKHLLKTHWVESLAVSPVVLIRMDPSQWHTWYLLSAASTKAKPCKPALSAESGPRMVARNNEVGCRNIIAGHWEVSRKPL